MKSLFGAVVGLITIGLTTQLGWAVEPTWNYAVQVSATVQVSPPQISFSWPQDSTANGYTVYRKAPGATSWGTGATIAGSAATYVDTGVTVGTAYEYQIVKAASGYTGYGYILTGINVPLVENRGKLVLIVDSTHASQLGAELNRLQQDLTGDGWTVIRHDVGRSDSVANVKNLIKADYNADPSNVKAVFLFGHVPVPYSGLLNPDGHNDHYGCWPADVYYGDMDGNWTDSSVNYRQTVNTDAADAARLSNVPGDGKFDQTTIPSAVELQVGRVDLANMPGRLTWGGPPTFPSELELLRQYLDKDHIFRHKRLNVQRRAVVGDYFGVRSGEAFAASGFRSFAPFFGASGVNSLNVTYNDAKGKWIPELAANDYLWAYGCGAGSYWTISGLGNSGLYNDGSTTEMVGNDTRAVFTLLFGSWLGDWDHEDNIMRSVLATRTYGLASAWSGRPHWFVHHMGLGETIGFSARVTQNNGSGGLYKTQVNSSANQIHIALMGDPALRLHPVAPPATLGGTAGAGSASLSWTSSPDSVAGYYVYRAASAAGPFTRLTSSLLAATSFVDTSAPSGATYMVRAVKLENTPSGSYYNGSQGLFWTAGGAPNPVDTTPPTINVTAPANNATVSGSSVAVSANASDNVGIVGVQFKLDGANLGAEDTSAPYSVSWNIASAANGLHTLTAVARDLAGNQTTAATVSVTVSLAAGGTSDVVWVEDAVPAGALPEATGGDLWSWVSSNPAPFSGATAHQSSIAAALHQHYFDGATATLPVSAGDRLFAYVYLDPANPPTEVMLQWTDGSWEHRAYWGANDIPWGADGTASRYYAGALPTAGQWARLEVPASAVLLEGRTLKGMAFTLSNGRATWDKAGKATTLSTGTDPAPTVTVTVTDAAAAEAGLNPGLFTITRSGGTTAALTVNFALSGTAGGSDYNALSASVTLPIGLASSTVVVAPVDDSIAEGSETVVLTLASQAAYTIGSPNSATITIADNDSTTPPPSTNPPPVVSVVNYTSLELPQIGDTALNILSPTVLELHLINTKDPDPAQVANWNFVDSIFQLSAPALSQFAVTVNGQPVTVQSVGFKRRPLYAPLVQRDLRIDNCLYLKLSSPITDDQTVEVKNPSGSLWSASQQFVAKAETLRYSPAIHVNQEGYVPAFQKKAMVGHYLGSLGEMDIPATAGFKLVQADSGVVVHQGSLVARPDVGYSYTPAPYQKVYEADFSAFTTPGEYRLVVPGLGASLPFLIDEGIAMNFLRTYALGMYHQRCGTDNALPHTRFTHDDCHVAPASIPSPQSSFAFTWGVIAQSSANYTDNPRHTAPQLKDEASMLYPFVNRDPIDVSRGHHDAGDYSKYTVNSASLAHLLTFAVDAMPGAAALDNLGLPESGDGIGDLLQEAKWEADFLAKVQDTDGGFYFLVYPRDRRYESNVTPDNGDPQIVWPKTTAATAAAVAALAQAASSPALKQRYPNEAALYLQKAQLGWQFLTNAINRYGKDGAYQKITHYGDNYMHDDELAWAACELFLATGDPAYHQKLKEWFDPSDPNTMRWGWWRMSESWGNAIRSYAFAVRTGRRQAGQLDAAFLAKCEAQILAAANDAFTWSDQNAYGSSFPEPTKRLNTAGWFFSSDHAADAAIGYLIDPKPEYLEILVANMNFEAGANPVNVSYLTGLGWKRQREIVHQYAQNDRRVLPPIGIPLGNIHSTFGYVDTYKGELRALCYPQDTGMAGSYPLYDRWGDSFNVMTEFIHLNQARGLMMYSLLASRTATKSQPWTSATGQIVGLPAQVSTNTPVTATLQVPGMDLSSARIAWEATGQEPAYGSSFTFVPTSYGAQWVEAEAQWPDGRRVFAVASLFGENNLPTVSIAGTDGAATEGTTDTASFTLTRTGSTAGDLTVTLAPTGTATKWMDYRRTQGDMPDSFTIPAGASSMTVTIVAVDDTEVEGTETATLTIQADANYNLGTPRSVSMAILDQGATAPPTVTVTATDANASEPGTDTGAFSVTRTGSTTSALTVNYTLSGTAGNGTDYNSLPTSVTIPAGAASATITLTPKDDATVEGSETVIVTVSSSTAYTTGSPGSATVTIADNDSGPTLPTVTVAATDASAGEAGPNVGVFTLTRGGSTASALTVNYTLGGTAGNGTDYNTLSSSATIPAGAGSATVTVTPKPDTLNEVTETVILTLAADANYTVGSPNNATVDIANARRIKKQGSAGTTDSDGDGMNDADEAVAGTDSSSAQSVLKISSITKADGDGITLGWPTVAGKIYRVSYSESVTDEYWIDLSEDIPGDGTSASWTDTSASSSAIRFYSVTVSN